jgi:hypothetical protein
MRILMARDAAKCRTMDIPSHPARQIAIARSRHANEQRRCLVTFSAAVIAVSRFFV